MGTKEESGEDKAVKGKSASTMEGVFGLFCLSCLFGWQCANNASLKINTYQSLYLVTQRHRGHNLCPLGAYTWYK